MDGLFVECSTSYLVRGWVQHTDIWLVVQSCATAASPVTRSPRWTCGGWRQRCPRSWANVNTRDGSRLVIPNSVLIRPTQLIDSQRLTDQPCILVT